MEVQRDTALEVFGLKKGFTQEELNKAFRRLSKVTHPDTGGDDNLFRFIMSCKETLSKEGNTNNSKTQTEKKQKQHQTAQKASAKEKTDIELKTLYNVYYDLNEYIEKYDIYDIYTFAHVLITPCKLWKEYGDISSIIELRQNFNEFQKLGFVRFATTLVIPKTFKKFKKFKVKVAFIGQKFEFNMKIKNPFILIEHKSLGFNTNIELNFE